jgi:hypothetical protein
MDKRKRGQGWRMYFLSSDIQILSLENSYYIEASKKLNFYSSTPHLSSWSLGQESYLEASILKETISIPTK